MQILTLNTGSSSFKARLYWTERGQLLPKLNASVSGLGTDQPKLKITFEAGEQTEQFDSGLNSDQILSIALDLILSHIDQNEKLCFSHRVVHGGDLFSASTVIDEAAVKALEGLIPLAPLHQPHNLHLIDLVKQKFPEIPSIACFDTMFHAQQDDLETSYALPKSVRDMKVRRYGFHGLSYEYIAQTLALDKDPYSRNLVLHLGAGASACAMRGARSIASSMGFSAADGLPMGTRTGQIDPGVLLFLLARGWSAEQLEHLIYRESGWLGLSGISSDMKTLLASNTEDAKFAIEHFCYHVALEVGRLTSALGGLDQLVFTGGVGAHSPEIRQRVAERLSWLGVQIDDKSSDRLISQDGSKVRVFAIETNEELMLAQHALKVVG